MSLPFSLSVLTQTLVMSFCTVHCHLWQQLQTPILLKRSSQYQSYRNSGKGVRKMGAEGGVEGVMKEGRCRRRGGVEGGGDGN